MKNTNLLTIGCLLAFSTMLNAQIIDGAIDDPGDIAFVAYHDDNDGFSFVFLDDCPIGTKIRFIDEEWTGSSFASASTEGEVLWENTSLSIITSGTVVHIENASDNASAPIAASIGTATEDDGGFLLKLTEDEIIAVTGTRSTPGVFLTLIGDTDSAGNTLSGTGLTNGNTAIHDASVTEGYYSGPTHCTGLSIQQCAQQLNDIANWTFGSFTYTADVPNNINTNNTISVANIKKTKLSYGPNPVKEKLSIVAETLIIQLEVYNSLGQKSVTFNPNSNQTTIDLSELKNGRYFLKTIFKNGYEAFSIQKN